MKISGITKKDTRAMLTLAFPAMITQLSATMVQVVDTMFIGRLGPLAIGAAAVTGIIIFNITAVGDGFGTGLVAAVSRMIGAGDRKNAAIFSTTGISVLTLIGAAFVPLFLAAGGNIFNLLQIPDELKPRAWEYYSVFISFTPAIFAFGALSASFRARGDTGTPMIVGVGINILNVFLDWTLIFGNLGFPELGVGGAAFASGLSFFSGALLLAVLSLFSEQGLFRLKRGYLSISHFIRIARIGMPSMIERFAMSFSQLLVMSIAVNPLGSNSIASFHIIMRLASLSFMPGFGFAMAAATLSGQHLGSEDPDGAERMLWVGTLFCGILMVLISTLYFGLSEPLIRLFTDSPEILLESDRPLKIYAALAVFLAPAMVLRGGLNGAGDTSFTLRMMIISRFIIRLPLSWLFGVHLGFGLSGVWFAMCMDFVIRGLSFIGYTKKGEWKEKRI
ncbi:MAG: MATE family efflux transporter [Spirochaetales bacterium]|uniref:Multidrug-efflux transporter n=1 Tax=Candidatus Thalassospirochaeta sargassi TaxID=3119039 RepID=A0AAJ1MN30_9SPIO|nr:MATE family efflux transporter [Spirochaetales bacterium]